MSIRTSTDAAGTAGAWPTGFTLNADGTITVAAGTAAGTYTLYYTICNQTAGSPCDTAAVTLTVPPTIDAIDGSQTVNSGSPGNSVIGNDTIQNGTAGSVTLGATGNATISQTSTTNAGVNIDTTTGNVFVSPGTPAGTYTITYQICTKATPSVCDTAKETVTVPNLLDAVNDTYASVTPGTSTTSVITNDKNIAGTAAVIGTDDGQVSIRTSTDAAGTAGAWPTGFTLNADGTISVANGTAAGTYTLYYTICNQTAGSPCDTTSVTITVQVDTDGDGITDNLDLDDDNDGILDTDEGLICSNFKFSFDGTTLRTRLSGTGTASATNLQVGDIWKIDNGVIETDALGNVIANGKKLDIIIEIKDIKVPTGGSVRFNTSSTGTNLIEIIGTANTNPYVIFNFRLANDETATTSNPYGTTAIINNFPLTFEDIDSNANQNFTELVGVRKNFASNYVTRTGTGSYIQNAGFVPLTSPDAIYDNINNSFDISRLNPATAGNVNDWNAEINTNSNDPNYANYTSVYNYVNFSNEDIVFGTTGTNSSLLTRATILGTQVFSICYGLDSDGDGTPNYLDLDSDNDGCLDAIEGGNNISTSQLVNAGGSLSVGTGSTASNQNLCAGSSCVDASGVPLIVGSNGQTVGDSQNAAVNSQCNAFCYKPAQTTGTTLDTNHGITALGRAGADNSNWPMVRKGAWTALEAKTKGFVVNRMASASTNVGTAPSYTTYLDEPVNSSGVAVITNPVVGMMFYDTRTDCLKINIDGTRAGWKCFNTQACPD